MPSAISAMTVYSPSFSAEYFGGGSAMLLVVVVVVASVGYGCLCVFANKKKKSNVIFTYIVSLPAKSKNHHGNHLTSNIDK